MEGPTILGEPLRLHLAHLLPHAQYQPAIGMGKCPSCARVSSLLIDAQSMLNANGNRWIYMLIVAMDANFHLQSKLQGAINTNYTLSSGWLYFVNNGPYLDFIKDYVDDDEVSIGPFVRS